MTSPLRRPVCNSPDRTSALRTPHRPGIFRRRHSARLRVGFFIKVFTKEIDLLPTDKLLFARSVVEQSVTGAILQLANENRARRPQLRRDAQDLP